MHTTKENIHWYVFRRRVKPLLNWCQPNDDKEQDRMDLGHHIYLLLLDGKLYLSPISTRPRRVLDLGTGTGIWAIDFAE